MKLWVKLMKPWNDEYGFAVNKRLKTISKVLAVISCIVGVYGILFFLVSISSEELGLFISSSIVMILIAFPIIFFTALMILWTATLGNNIAHIRQKIENNHGKVDTQTQNTQIMANDESLDIESIIRKTIEDTNK